MPPPTESQPTMSVEHSASGANVSFPLPAGYFGTPQISAAQHEQYRAMARDRLNATLATERMFLSNQRTRRLGAVPSSVTRVDLRQWKPVRTKHDLRVFRRRGNGKAAVAMASQEEHRDMAQAVQAGHPSLLCIGRVEGSLDDVLYGWYNPTQEETQATMRHIDGSIMDCAALATLETAENSQKHPMHYLGLKWMLAKSPASFVLAPRDWCMLEAMGVTADYDGRRVGYFIQHSVDVPCCPPFAERATGIVRGRIFFAFLFRENTPGFVDVFARGVFDPAGDMMPKIASGISTNIFLALHNVVRCAEAKKLTLLSNMKQAIVNPSDYERRRRCGVCDRKAALGLELTRRRNCHVCRLTVCSNCRTTRTMFVRGSMSTHVSVKKLDCCLTCEVEAKRMINIRPYTREHALFPGSRRHVSFTPDGSGSDAGTGSSRRRAEHVDLPSQSIAAAGFAESVTDGDEDRLLMSDVTGFESDSELEDETDDEVVDVELFNQDDTPVVSTVTEDEPVEPRPQQFQSVGAAYDAFTRPSMMADTQPASSSPPVAQGDPAALLEKIMALHNSVQEAYSMTQANRELMAKMMRAA